MYMEAFLLFDAMLVAHAAHSIKWEMIVNSKDEHFI